MAQPVVIVIAGPTASGKTALAIRLAQELGTVIISADARQCFREMSIGVAKPAPAELAAVPHYFINSHSVHDTVNAAVFGDLAMKWSAEIFQRHDCLIVAGGSGLYINAFCDGLDELPPPDPLVRAEVRGQYALHGIGWLQDQVRSLDPLFAEKGEMMNPHRLQRALEVVKQSGGSILLLHGRQPSPRPFHVIHHALRLPREELNERIDRRVQTMMDNGLAAEVRNLMPLRHLPALQTVGYQELFPALEKGTDIDEATALIQRHTRQYAKRQMTWFRRDERYRWLDANGAEETILSALRSLRG